MSLLGRTLVLLLALMPLGCELFVERSAAGSEASPKLEFQSGLADGRGAKRPRWHAPSSGESPQRHGGSVVPRRSQSLDAESRSNSGQLTPELEAAHRRIFESPEACQAELVRGGRMPRREGVARIGTLNVRWFPDGVPGGTPRPSMATDVEWLSCVLAWLNLDALALQEIKISSHGRDALALLTQRLDAQTGGRHRAELDDCPLNPGQHVGWLVDTTRVSAQHFEVHGSINPKGDACTGQLRPGLGVDLTFPGGLDAHFVSLHLKSGATENDLTLRKRSLESFAGIARRVAERRSDGDVVFLGDFNTMGCEDCLPVVGSSAEAAELDRTLLAAEPSTRRVPAEPPCTHYYQRRPGLLDHFVATRSMLELPAGLRSQSFGVCRLNACESRSGASPAASRHLSDHCPLVLELPDQKRD